MNSNMDGRKDANSVARASLAALNAWASLTPAAKKMPASKGFLEAAMAMLQGNESRLEVLEDFAFDCMRADDAQSLAKAWELGASPLWGESPAQEWARQDDAMPTDAFENFWAATPLPKLAEQGSLRCLLLYSDLPEIQKAIGKAGALRAEPRQSPLIEAEQLFDAKAELPEIKGADKKRLSEIRQADAAFGGLMHALLSGHRKESERLEAEICSIKLLHSDPFFIAANKLCHRGRLAPADQQLLVEIGSRGYFAKGSRSCQDAAARLALLCEDGAFLASSIGADLGAASLELAVELAGAREFSKNPQTKGFAAKTLGGSFAKENLPAMLGRALRSPEQGHGGDLGRALERFAASCRNFKECGGEPLGEQDSLKMLADLAARRLEMPAALSAALSGSFAKAEAELAAFSDPGLRAGKKAPRC